MTSTTQIKTNPMASFRDQLLAEEPKIDAALKSFCSYLVASTTASTTHPPTHTTTNEEEEEPVSVVVWNMQTALACVRPLSKAINAHIVPIDYQAHATPVVTPASLMTDTAAQVWNELAAQAPGTKITKLLGRTALKLVWKDIDLQAVRAVQPGGDVFVQTFATMLLQDDAEDDSDHALSSSNAVLIWGGPAALQRRAAQRQAVAAQRVQDEKEQLKTAISPIIEELPNDDNDDDDKKPAAQN